MIADGYRSYAHRSSGKKEVAYLQRTKLTDIGYNFVYAEKS